MVLIQFLKNTLDVVLLKKTYVYTAQPVITSFPRRCDNWYYDVMYLLRGYVYMDLSARELLVQYLVPRCWRRYFGSAISAFGTEMRFSVMKSSVSASGRFGSLLPIEFPVKTLIRLYGCAGWSESSLGTHAILLDMLCYNVYPCKLQL